MRVLGIDLGLKRTGLALSDEMGLSVRLLPSFHGKNRKELVEIILQIVTEYAVKVVLIGCPEEKTISSKAIVTRVLGLKEALLQLFKEINLAIEVILWDETLSSKKALANLLLSGVPRKRRSKLIDANSAAVMVEEFLYSYKKYD